MLSLFFNRPTQAQQALQSAHDAQQAQALQRTIEARLDSLSMHEARTTTSLLQAMQDLGQYALKLKRSYTVKGEQIVINVTYSKGKVFASCDTKC